MNTEFTDKEIKILNLIADYCSAHPCHDACVERCCILYQMERIIFEDEEES